MQQHHNDYCSSIKLQSNLHVAVQQKRHFLLFYDNNIIKRQN